MDLITAPRGSMDLGRFTEKRYKSVVRYKIAFYFFCFPVTAAMCMVGSDGEKEHSNAKKILLEMGEFFQVQGNYLDLFVDHSVMGMVGIDVQDNKCSWLVAPCMLPVSPEQHHILQENCGQKDAEMVARVKALDKELDPQAILTEYEEDRATLWLSSRSTVRHLPGASTQDLQAEEVNYRQPGQTGRLSIINYSES